MKIHTFKTPPYFETVKVVVCKDFEKAMDRMKVKYTIDVNSYEAVVNYPEGREKITLFIRKGVSAGVIAHESVHIANCIFNRIGASLDSHNDEPYAYLLGWIVDCITNILKK